MHRGRLKTPHHCDKVLFEPLALEEAVWPDFGLLTCCFFSLVYGVHNGSEMPPRVATSLAPRFILTVVRFLALATSKDNGETYL